MPETASITSGKFPRGRLSRGDFHNFNFSTFLWTKAQVTLLHLPVVWQFLIPGLCSEFKIALSEVGSEFYQFGQIPLLSPSEVQVVPSLVPSQMDKIKAT